eukprot:TRINITY_DN64296_c0_g1_i1.p1 TRINITY_DN64296_c0_g1~~TRINITY_DN64296_c0_g1_i1.p1  ORF type:complete len:486 (-),score=81.45 TRINITY_DN64296_c0_g1_i1:376-1833(-)
MGNSELCGTARRDAEARAAADLRDRRQSTGAHGREARSVYVGSYGMLLKHIDDCRNDTYITQEEYDALLAAIEDVSQHGGKAAVDSSGPHFKGDRHHCNSVLPAHGIFVRDCACIANGSFSQFFDSKQLGDEDVSMSRASLSFNSRSRGDVAADTRMIVKGLDAFSLMDRCLLDLDSVCAWIQTIGVQYHGKPYHNWLHAVDVYQIIHFSLEVGRLTRYLSKEDVLVLLVSAIGHDVGHPGVNNLFLVNSGAQLAITYNDRSVLENMHASLFFETLRRPGLNFAANMNTLQFQSFRAKVIDCIMATDMARHFGLLDRFSARVMMMQDEGTPVTKGGQEDGCGSIGLSGEGSFSSKEDRGMLITAFMHMADLGQSARPWQSHRLAVKYLEQEFFAQGDQERELGIPISPLMDRSKESLAGGQAFFLKKLVQPMLEPCCFFLEKALADALRDNLERNEEKWTELLQKYGKNVTAERLLELEDAEGEN